MKRNCESLKQLSSQGHWDDIFNCLNIDANSTIELANLQIPVQQADLWLDDHRATLNSLEAFLGFIVFCDEIMYYALLVYLILFGIKLRQSMFYVLQHLYLAIKLAFKKYTCKPLKELNRKTGRQSNVTQKLNKELC